MARFFVLSTAGQAILAAALLAVSGCVSPGQVNTMDVKLDSLKQANEALQRKASSLEKAYQAQLEENQKLGAELKSSIRELSQRLEAVAGQVQDVNGRFDYLFRNWEEFRVRLQNLRPPPDSLLKGGSPAGGSNVGVDPKQLYDNAFLDFRRGKYDLSIAGFEEFLATFPGSELVPNCHFWIGEAFNNKGMADSAVGRYLLVSQTFPRSEKAPTSLYKAAQLLEKGDPAMAQKYYAMLVDQYPTSSEVRRARDRLNALRKK
ncbi:MAG: tol-pal system protein YbgF [candidate division Zixibacteria bacterium]|nr:tol-pal system protein YbgF [candidate division Zixibacteria bacterium]